MFFTVYQTTNTINNKIYIGTHITANLNDDYLGSGLNIIKAINKYGANSFTKTILFSYDNPNEMFAKEAELVNEEFVNRPDTYNLKIGGEGGWDYINKTGLNNPIDLIAKNRKISQTLKGRKPSISAIEANKKLHKDGKVNYITFLGKHHTEETKRKIGKANSIHQSGIKNSQYGTMWITNGKDNKKILKDQFDIYANMGYTRGRKR